MSTQTIIIIAVVAVVWAVAFVVMLSMGKKRENSEKKFNETPIQEIWHNDGY